MKYKHIILQHVAFLNGYYRHHMHYPANVIPVHSFTDVWLESIKTPNYPAFIQVAIARVDWPDRKIYIYDI